ncbi:MAG: hypothetical protein RL563_2750 [Pseudomonadota bacterium]|jgi:hypothetical protein
MRHTRLNPGFFAALLLAVPVVNAQDYPAADFQPKVLFRDESVVVAPASQAAPSPVSTPCVNNQQPAVAAKQEVSEFDPKYPASSFQPKVIFSQAN